MIARAASAAVLAIVSGCVAPGGPAPTRPLAVPQPEPFADVSPAPKPAWEARPVVARALTGPDGRRYHRVSAGDAGIAIARAYGIAWSAIVAANGLTDPFILHIGQRLLLPGGAKPDPAARAAAFRIDIDDLATGSSPAQFPVDRPSAPARVPFAAQFDWPTTGKVVERFGAAGEGRVNRGVDIAGAPGALVRAAAPGTIAFTGTGGPAGYGDIILVRHGDGWISVYGRIARATVARGQIVKAGDTIGTIDDKAMLHFELRRHRIPVDPIRYLPPR